MVQEEGEAEDKSQHERKKPSFMHRKQQYESKKAKSFARVMYDRWGDYHDDVKATREGDTKACQKSNQKICWARQQTTVSWFNALKQTPNPLTTKA